MKKENILEVQSSLIQWYSKHQRKLPWRKSDDPYRIWVSEVMLQQTQVNTVIPYYETFTEKFPAIEDLAKSDLEKVLKAWEGLGYYARARNLHKASKVVIKDFNGKISDEWETFKRLPGVGEYIASAVLSIAFNKPYAVVDGNVKRVLSRLFSIDQPVNKASSDKLFKTNATCLLDRTQPGTFNQAMMELGAIVCKPGNPQCDICPIQPFCQAYQKDKVDEYPKRIQRKPVPVYHIATGIIRKNGKMLVTRRKPEGLLGGLWEFPGGKLKKKESPEKACIREILEETGLIVEIDSHLTSIKHAYSHFKIRMDVFYCRYVSGKVNLNGPDTFRWIKLEDINNYAFPKANLKFIPLITE